MITRYHVNFVDQMIEPTANGKWVKYEDHEQIEANAGRLAEERLAKVYGKEHEDFVAQSAQVVDLSNSLLKVQGELEVMLRDKEATIERQRFLLKAAKDRLKLHGHTPTCEARYGTISVGGQMSGGACSCGLDAWFKDTGVAHA